MARTRFAAAALAASISLGWAGLGLAQDPPKDDALDRLLEKLEGEKPAPAAEPAPKPKDDKPADAKKDETKKAEAKKDETKKADPKAKPAPEAEPEDKTLDSLLEKLGETEEAPKTTGPAGGAPTEETSGPTPKPQPEDASAEKLREGQKPLDRHLEELTGRIIKDKQAQDGQQGQGQSGPSEDTPIGRAVKKMREVETKLGETDTGEETRKKQGEIVKELEQMIAQAKRQGQGKGSGKGRPSRQPGQPGGNQPGEEPGTDPNARGAGPMKTKTPNNTPALAGSKDTWGNLPAMLRDEMDNVMRTESLPKKARQISRYYESIAKKSTAPPRGE